MFKFKAVDSIVSAFANSDLERTTRPWIKRQCTVESLSYQSTPSFAGQRTSRFGVRVHHLATSSTISLDARCRSCRTPFRKLCLFDYDDATEIFKSGIIHTQYWNEYFKAVTFLLYHRNSCSFFFQITKSSLFLTRHSLETYYYLCVEKQESITVILKT